jgi:hypothetical protein
MKHASIANATFQYAVLYLTRVSMYIPYTAVSIILNYALSLSDTNGMRCRGGRRIGHANIGIVSVSTGKPQIL